MREHADVAAVRDRHARVGEQPTGDPSVGPVVALAGDHVDDATVGPTESAAGVSGDCVARPGDEYVDWVGIDGYNFGTAKSGMSWRSFNETFKGTYDIVTGLTSRPVMIGETGSTESGGDKAAWIRRSCRYTCRPSTRNKAAPRRSRTS